MSTPLLIRESVETDAESGKHSAAEVVASNYGGFDFDSFYETYFLFIRTAVDRLRLPPATRDDVIQDVFVVVATAADRLPDIKNIHGWLVGVVRNVARKHWRLMYDGEKRRVVAGEESGDFQLFDSGESPELQSASRERRRLLHRLLLDLSAEHREAVLLVEIEGLDPAQAAVILDVNINTLYSRLRRAKEQMAEASRFWLSGGNE